MTQKVADGIWLIAEFISVAEAKRVISEAEEAGFVSALQYHAGRDNEQTALKQPSYMAELAERLRARLSDIAPENLALPGMVQVYRYKEGHSIAPHTDAATPVEDKGDSTHTLLIYLNRPKLGGQTIFPELGVSAPPLPRAAILFEQRLVHAGAPVHQGVKYVLRAPARLTF